MTTAEEWMLTRYDRMVAESGDDGLTVKEGTVTAGRGIPDRR